MAVPRIRSPLQWKEIFRFTLSLLLFRRPEKAKETIASFEHRFAESRERRHGVVFCRARMALYHFLRQSGLQAGEVVISGLHVADFVNIIRLAGFTPVVADVEVDGYGIDFADLDSKVGPQTRLIYVTHLSGHATDMPRIMTIADRVGALVVEDCSQALETRFAGRRMGSWGVAAIYSLSLMKSVCTMNGGMLLTDDDAVAERLRQCREGLPPPRRLPLAAEAIKNMVLMAATWRPLFSTLVFPLLRINAKGGDRFARFQKTNKTVALRNHLPRAFLENYGWQQAQLGLSQLGTVDAREIRRIVAAQRMVTEFRPSRSLRLGRVTPDSHNTYWLFPLLASDPSRLREFLASRGIDSSPMLLSALSDEEAFLPMAFTGTHAPWTRAHTVFIPVYDDGDVSCVAAAIREYQDGPYE